MSHVCYLPFPNYSCMEGRIELGGTERRHLGVHVEVTDALNKH